MTMGQPPLQLADPDRHTGQLGGVFVELDARGRRGMTWSARCAAVSTIRRVVQEGQTPLHLQE